ncbi:serine/threonine-protein kinase S6KL-like isoform X1 [Vespa velutina]|uniref:serine/threonine-protein kinase S6KL-like isoform X1 n=1 Tax=Vespa velutina TaxID=202808 RepID=UPI001FB3BDBF|nr:serine/threonine-protein kinase S6KL-like isoform X1 [Vespa velutina]
MGNSNVKKKYHDHQKYASQYSLIDIIGGSCAGSTRSFQVEIKSWSRSSYRSSSKTAWPIPRSEAIFLPEFKVRKMTLNTEYSFLDVIAKGAYGRVYKVQSRENRQVFALKVISKAKIITENAVTQAKQEVAIQRMVGHHPFIVNSTHRWQSSKTLYILTDYMCGGELFSLVEKYGCLPEQVVRIYVAEVALAIDFLHNAGVVHRDLKATNILLDEEGHAMIIDFGLSKWLHRTQRTNTFCGTPEYMAPEILKRQFYGQEVDWWSLGVLMCFLLTNRYPSNVPCELFSDRIEQNSPVPPGTLPAGTNLSHAATDLLKRLLQPDPLLRLRSILTLQTLAFYMGYSVQSYMYKKESPFKLLGRSKEPMKNSLNAQMRFDFADFDSFVVRDRC